jgi:Cu-Zn family superoxide dismutase
VEQPRYDCCSEPSMRTALSLIGLSTLMATTPAAWQTPPGAPPPRSAVTARAALVDTSGKTMGDALLRETPNGVLLKVDLESAEAGVHGFHIHETGRCDRSTFESAGGHFAPRGAEHGLLDPKGPHAGDLPNVHVPADGSLSFELLVPDVTLRSAGDNSLLDGDGSALVMHRNRDDYTSEPAGSAGDRIACGVIMR